MLPRASLRDDGFFLPPRALDGQPAPTSEATPPQLAQSSRAVAEVLVHADWGSGERGDATRRLWDTEMSFYGPVGVGLAVGRAAYEAHVLGPLHAALADRRFEVDVLSCEGNYCGAHGYIHGRHIGCFLGQPATHRAIKLRAGMHWHVINGKAVEGWAIFDFPMLFKEAFGVDLFARNATPLPCP